MGLNILCPDFYMSLFILRSTRRDNWQVQSSCANRWLFVKNKLDSAFALVRSESVVFFRILQWTEEMIIKQDIVALWSF